MVCVVLFERTITQFGKEASDFVNVTGGVLQSSKLGTIAFVIKINMLPSVIEQVVAQGVNDDVSSHILSELRTVHAGVFCRVDVAWTPRNRKTKRGETLHAGVFWRVDVSCGTGK